MRGCQRTDSGRELAAEKGEWVFFYPDGPEGKYVVVRWVPRAVVCFACDSIYIEPSLAHGARKRRRQTRGGGRRWEEEEEELTAADLWLHARNVATFQPRQVLARVDRSPFSRVRAAGLRAGPRLQLLYM